MRAWRYPLVVVLILTESSLGRAQSCDLIEKIGANSCFRYNIQMQLSGEMRFNKDTGVVPVKVSATATHTFQERIYSMKANMVEKCARVYGTAKLALERGTDRSTTELRPSRKLIVAQRHKDTPLTYSPAGAMYRGELDLVSEHFDTLTLPGILPGKTLNAGETWKVTNIVAQTLCGLEGMTENKLEGKLEKVVGDEATFSVKGTAAGVEGGALVKASVDAIGMFSIKNRQMTRLNWNQRSERDQGPISPASTMNIKVTVDRTAIAQSLDLSDVALVSVPEGFTVPGPMTNVEFRDPKDRFALLHTRDWHLTAVTGDHTVLRLIDRGDYVAQLTVTPWTPAKKGERLTPEQFKSAMNNTSGWRPEKELQSGEIKSDGRYVYRLSVQGLLDGVNVLQNFYLVAAPTGEQVVLTFTLSPRQADKLGARDLSIAASIEVPASPQR